MKLAIISFCALAPAAAVFGFQLYPTTIPRCRISTVIRHVGAEPGERRRSERQFISILTNSVVAEQEDGHGQMLPTAFASRFPLWVIDKNDSGQKHAVEVPGASEVGWVNPRSYSELWIPEDSMAPTMRLCLGMLIKDGVPRHVMPMVDLVVLKGGRKWRNRGLNTVPTAHCWEAVERAAAGVLHMSAYYEEKVKDSKTDSMWGALAEKVPVTEALTEIMTVLADPPEELQVESGFHFIVAEVAGFGQLTVPGSGGRVRMFLSDMQTPSDLLELPEVVGVSELGFDVVAVASGAESEFLPEVYRELFVDESC